ncbi:MAG: polyphosphate kinase 2 family protein [Planctomycetaceae bacterium]|nr:polyphosphate kinase 2 family protein [Planctomycetaceae bacterium]MCB9953330.1 polyphosphate kinase 2 family protein [Planctomycetaceae bacterium]
MPAVNSPHLIKPGSRFDIRATKTHGDNYHPSRKEAEEQFEELREELIQWQYKLYAEQKQKLLVVLQAMDAGGKDGTIRKVFTGVNPQGVEVTSFKVPSKEELSHDFLWRIHKAAPATGMIGVFNRSHYEDVLVVRVENIVPESVWRPRYETINHFEKLLADAGTRIVKFYLHISRDEQKERFQERLDNPGKHWKFSMDDLRKREQWDDYMDAYEDALNNCSTNHALWYVIPADSKWYRNYAITKILVETLRDMNPDYPESEDDLSGVVIE